MMHSAREDYIISINFASYSSEIQSLGTLEHDKK